MGMTETALAESQIMPHFPITETVEDALALARRARRDDLGYCYFTFRIALTSATGDWSVVLSRLIDAGWQLQGGPHVVETTGEGPRHLVLSMLHAEPRPLQIRGEVRMHGDIRCENETRV